MADSRIRVLLIEDNPGDARLVQEFLTEAGGGSIELVHVNRLSAGLERLDAGGIDVVLLDLGLPDSQGLETFHRAQARARGTPIVILSGGADETTAVQAVREGAQDYLTKGQVSAPALVRAMRYAIERRRTQVEPASVAPHPSTGKVLGFVGAKGGVGTTTVALNVASILAQRGRGVIAVELRSDWGTFSAQLNHAPAANLRSLLDLDPKQIDAQALQARLLTNASGLRLLFGPQRLEEYKDIDPPQVEAVLLGLADLAEYTVVDLPPSGSRANKAAIHRCDRVVLMLERDPVCVRAAARMLELLKVYGASAGRVVAVLVNRTPLTSQLDMAEIGSMLACEISVVIPAAWEDCTRAQRQGVPLAIALPGSVASARLMQLADRLVAGGVTQVGA